MKLNDNLPEIDCVVIGVNASSTLARCLRSIRACSYPQDKINITYVDGGSVDDSISIAESITGVRTIALTPEYPSPGLGRNAGWKAGSSPLVQFLDSDTVLDSNWLREAVGEFSHDVAAVSGYRQEMYPNHSVYNWIGSLEWNGKPGDAGSFGGDVLVRRQALVETGGYDEVLVGGEDPELSRRICSAGWRLRQLDKNMTYHDLAIYRFSQYWKRAYRSGYGFAAVVDRTSDTDSVFWQKEFQRIVVRGGGFVGLTAVAMLILFLCPATPHYYFAVAMIQSVALFLLLYPRIFRVRYFMEDKQLNRSQARVYAWHCSMVVLPDIFGVVRYYLGKLCRRPLRNKKSKLATAAAQHRL